MNSAAIAVARPIAKISRHGRVVTFEPPIDRVLWALGTYGIEQNEETYGGQTRRHRRLCWVEQSSEQRGVAVTRAGLQAVVDRIYTRLGFQVRHIVDEANQDAFEPVESPETQCRAPLDRALIELVRTTREGIFRYSPGRIDVAWLIAQIALNFPRLRIIAVVNHKDEGRRLAQRLRPILGNVPAVDASTSLDVEEEPRIAVATLVGLVEVNFEWVDILVFVRAREVTASRAQDPVNLAHKPRIFGLLPYDVWLSAREGDLIRSVFGFAEISIPAHGKVVRPVEVLQCDLWGGPRREARTAVDVLRTYVWGDPLRSRRVAKLAQLIARGDTDTLRSEFPRIADVVSPRSTSNQSVAVICDSADHLMYQAHWLPNWMQVPFLDQSSRNGSAPAGRRRVPDQSFGVVITRDALASGQLDISGVDVAIYAGANPHPPIIPVELLSADPSNVRPVQLIDFRDRRHPELRCRSRERMERYAENEWFAPGVDPVEARVDHFIDTRRSS